GLVTSQIRLRSVAVHRQENRPGDRDDVTNNHDCQDDASGQKSQPEGRSLKETKKAKIVLKLRLNNPAHQWHDDENAEEPVNDAGNGSEKVDEKLKRVRDS